VGGGQAVVDERDHQCQERRDQGAYHDAAHKAAQECRQEQQDQAEHDGERDVDQEHQDQGAEDVPGVTAHGPHALAERVDRAGLPYDDEGHDEAPERQQDEARHDKQYQADRDPN
jgi:hypothetical protein